MKTIRYCETDFKREEQPVIDQLRKDGLFVYSIRDRERNKYSIEIRAWVNRIGFMVTDTDLEPYIGEFGLLSDEMYKLKDVEWVDDYSLQTPSVPVL